MLPPLVAKYGFRIRTRIGLVVDNLMIYGRDESEARSKLRQMYRDCEILDCACQRGTSGERKGISVVSSALCREEATSR